MYSFSRIYGQKCSGLESRTTLSLLKGAVVALGLWIWDLGFRVDLELKSNAWLGGQHVCQSPIFHVEYVNIYIYTYIHVCMWFRK